MSLGLPSFPEVRVAAARLSLSPRLSLPFGSGNLNIDPSQSSALPGSGTLSALASGVGHWALIASVVGVMIGGVMWAFGHFSHNYQQSYQGRKGVLVSGLAALLIGASQTIVGFFFSQGQSLH